MRICQGETMKKLEYSAKEIGEKVREYRKKRGLSLKQLSRKVNRHWSAVQRWEKGKTRIPMNKIKEVAEILEIPPSVLLSEESLKIEYPYLSKIAAGEPILANKNIKCVLNLENLFPKGTQYCLLKIKGESLKDCGINNNDYVLIDTSDINPSEHGIYAIAIFENDIENVEATLKKIKIRRNTIALIPANPEYEIKLYKKSDIRIVGKVIRVIKKF